MLAICDECKGAFPRTCPSCGPSEENVCEDCHGDGVIYYVGDIKVRKHKYFQVLKIVPEACDKFICDTCFGDGFL